MPDRERDSEDSEAGQESAAVDGAERTAEEPTGGGADDPSPGREVSVDYREVFRKVSDGILLHDPETGEVLEANPAMCEMTGYDREQLVGMDVAEFSAVEAGYTSEEARKRIRKAAREGPQVFEWLDEDADGERFWVEVHLRRAEFDGQDLVLAVVRDIDDRKSLENSLESLQSATSHLVRADSKAEACERAVEAAERVLSFPVLGVHLYDEEADALEPVAHTRAAERLLDGEPPTVEDPASPTWQAFAAGEPAHHEDVLEVVDADEPSPPVRSQLVFPLGSHGAMVVGDPDPGGFDDDQIELAGILAANLEAAMNRAEGRRRLRERERQLQRETERARRLERLNRIVRDIEAALVEESTRAGIERAVCERLVAAEPFELAWVGDADAAAPTPRTLASDDDHGDPVDGHVGRAPESHPAKAAVRTGSPHAVQDIADAPCGEWRRRALTRGHRSACAVGLSYGGALHGVLTVYADETGAFDDEVRETLARLGQTIGYALTAVERRHALESDVTTELEFRIRDRGLAPVELAERTGHRVVLERSIRRSGEGVGVFYGVEADDDVDRDRLVTAATDVDGVEAVRVVNDDGDRYLLECQSDSWFGSTFADHGAVVRSLRADGDDGGRMVVEAPSGADVRTLVDGFQERYPGTELLAHREGQATDHTATEVWDDLEERLTDRQREVLETAYSAGYFEWPRESSGEEIAQLLDITQPTLNKHLRLAEQAAFSLLLGDEDDR